MTGDPLQRTWWEEGCYRPPGECACGTEQDFFRVDADKSERTVI